MADRLEVNVAAQLAKGLLAEARALEQIGDALSRRRAQAIRHQAERLMLDQGITDPDVEAERMVTLTVAENTQAGTDESTAATVAAATAVVDANEKTIRDAINARLAGLRAARDAIAAGTIFASLTVNERKVIDALVRDDIGIARLLLRKLDSTD
ncbi:MAG: hypothetical protein NUW01_13845 [Gemmatimonadaceae bacterium]|nr:hypothetical protein [Gemmatimonadaceae bacterium]